MDWVDFLLNRDLNEIGISKKMFISIVDAIDDGVFITDEKGIIIFVNNGYLQLTGLSRENLLNIPIQSLVKQGVISRSVSLDVIKTHQEKTLLQSLKNGKELLVTGHPVFNEEKKLIAVITSVRDITALTEAQNAQRELEDIKNTQKKYSGLKSTTGFLEHLSDSTNRTYKKAERIASSDIKILIQGNTGTGKTVLARHIHKCSERRDKPFLEINCATMPEGLLESELFGYVPGAFTGALQKGKKGLFEAVNGGTLFLDEIGDLPLALQAKILKVLEDNRFIPVGGFEYIYTDVRIISATHHDLLGLVEKGLFRNDLYYRVCVATLHLDDLKDRLNELGPLLELYLEIFNEKYRLNKSYAEETIDLIKRYAWPGNIRELTNFVEQTVVMSEMDIIQPQDIPANIQQSIQKGHTSSTDQSLKRQVDEFEYNIISQALERYKTTQKAAQILGIDQSTLVKKRQRYLERY
ncbi:MULTISPECIES: sigma-54 interaction domain-containing protein [Acinetobacter]|uniref:sigma-54 interaction domain-containing protein n=1 Tax=Acinetobacter TaxID=469 RepID=UPI001A1203AA|nr:MULTISPECIES: sigma 54-interacting transcriptional regulator [Acinetobacter]MCU4388168.1 sigma 54-interacting transcriptional regulator [Acinetobacter haemolyticus]HIQ35574.1 PAS domain S-box protein [Acinetobacter venetianus]HJP46358.1 sigma 54-interacting transcriptional regulator [Acinetobacter venetianus]